jgi:PDZ domain-containing protein
MYIEGEKVELGDYNLAYVSVSRGNLVNLLLSKVISNWDLVKEENLVIPDTDYETTLKLEKIDMQNSINIAKYIAYQKANKEAEISIKSSTVYGIDEQAETDLQILDELVSVDGFIYKNNMTELNEYIDNLEVGKKIDIIVNNNGHEYTRFANIIEIDGRHLIGIYLHHVYEVTTDPKMEIKSKDSEAGSSGGLMLTLAIYDALMEKDMTSGKKIVGTGTIEFDGSVGSIGGVKYKLLGAEKAKADIFFIPEENYEEAKEVYTKYKLKLKLVPVKTFDDVINYLNGI